MRLDTQRGRGGLQRGLHRVGLAVLRGRLHRDALRGGQHENGQRKGDRREMLHLAFAQQQREHAELQAFGPVVAVEELVRVVLVVPLERAPQAQDSGPWVPLRAGWRSRGGAHRRPRDRAATRAPPGAGRPDRGRPASSQARRREPLPRRRSPSFRLRRPERRVRWPWRPGRRQSPSCRPGRRRARPRHVQPCAASPACAARRSRAQAARAAPRAPRVPIAAARRQRKRQVRRGAPPRAAAARARPTDASARGSPAIRPARRVARCRR